MAYKVYWTEEGVANSVDFDKDGMTQALHACEALRKRQREGDNVSFVSLCSEHPDNVTKMGVDVTGPDYDWKKRRK